MAEEIKLSKSAIRTAAGDASLSAKAVNLVYVNENHLSITREGAIKSFHYFIDKKKIKDPVLLERFKKLAIPPAWKNVRICKLNNGHLQATGYDALNRKQYRYHPMWSIIRNQTKFYRLFEFGKQLPSMRAQLERDLSLPGSPREKILAAVVSLMERTHIRIGNSFYEKLYGSFGLTTLKNSMLHLAEQKCFLPLKGRKVSSIL